MTETTGRTPLVIRSIPDAIAAVPYLLGFHPTDSIVVIGFGGPHNTCAVRADLPPPDDPGRFGQTAENLVGMLVNGEFPQALLLGYGPPIRVDRTVAAIRDATLTTGLGIVDAARVADGRWWSLTCAEPECCPPGGKPYDISTSVVAAQATLAGQVALADRSELADSVAPLAGATRTAMRRATRDAEQRFRSLTLLEVTRPRLEARLRTEAEGLLLLLRRPGARPDHDQIAWLGLLLTNLRVRDEAFVRLDLDDPSADIDFWRTILRHVEEPYSCAPACLLARAAYAAGDGGLANVALERASPDYSMADLLRAVIAAGIPPTEPGLRMTPEDLTTAYAEHDADPCPDSRTGQDAKADTDA
ncbi:DUF4192 domain-containing protein [Actinomadura sp. 9N407]|uniref:DUF4192 domain-containing protein n=1 Tax=Actinomadura sp. 9N407 TaxID=3375154 RepID=UPI0037B26AEB